MPRPLVSVCLATYQRAHLLERSLQCYEASNGLYPPDDLELVVIDDHSTDHTQALVREWSKRTGIRSTVIVPHPKPNGQWRDCGAVLNYGIRASSGRHILLTHPEVMPGQRSVAKCVEALEEVEAKRGSFHPEKSHIGLYACCKVYYLSPRDQGLLDTVNWYSEGAIAVRKIEGFYESDVGGHPDFSHRATDLVATPGFRIPNWESLVFGGLSRESWKRLGGLQPTVKWGSVDVLFMGRRRRLGIPTYTCPDEDCIVVHQNHDGVGNVPSPRIESVWKEELKSIDMNPSKLVYPYVNELWG